MVKLLPSLVIHPKEVVVSNTDKCFDFPVSLSRDLLYIVVIFFNILFILLLDAHFCLFFFITLLIYKFVFLSTMSLNGRVVAL